VAVLPLGRPAPTEEEQDPDNPMPVEPPVGALIIERIEDSRIPETMLQRVEVVAKHSSIALANATEHQDLFLMPLWRTLGRSKWLFRARTLPKTLAISGAVLLALACLVVVPWDFNLHCDGTLEPVRRSDVFARVDGVVKSVTVRHGDKVTKGQVLAELRSTEIDVRIRGLDGELRATQAQLRSKRQMQMENRGSNEDLDTISGDIAALEKKELSLESQLALEQEKAKDLQIVSPRDGRIVTWDLEILLAGRPVQRGQVLMQVADTEGPWQLELQIPEDRMGYLVRAQDEFDPDLPVTFILATEPGVEHRGKIKEVHYSAEVQGEKGNTVLAKVDIEGSADKAQFADLRPGAEVKAKVNCGRRSIGYILFHDLWAFVESRVLFRF
jgi:multidrug efflux pump subunit AcrA (membrane-fusion protein)